MSDQRSAEHRDLNTGESGDSAGKRRSILDSLGISEGVVGNADPLAFARSLVQAARGAARHPTKVAGAGARFMTGMASASLSVSAKLFGAKVPGPVAPDPKDKRFADPAWSDNALFYGLMQVYLLTNRLTMEIVEAAQLKEPAASKARFAAQLLVDAAAPTNMLLTNPAALKRSFETGGQSVLKGTQNLLVDIRTNDGWPRQVDLTPFKLGENMAATKGNVVYRNDLIELIQYEAQTDQVHEIPLLMCPPWINKFYIMDLAPGKSLIEWAIKHQQTTFAISYRNPDSSMRNVSFEDYLLKGPRAALDIVREITGAPKVNTLGVCLGGTLNTTLLAYLNATGEDLVNTSTYLNSLTDFSHAGTLKDVFSDIEAIDGLAKRMEAKGYLDAKSMSRTFDLLRANDLIFSYVQSNWLMGNTPPAFDLLAWNADSTRMPAKMHSFYLRKCYFENALCQDAMELAGQRLIVSEIPNETYIVSAVDDHIVPWPAAYATTQIFKGPCRFVLSSAGHIAGIVNPPNPKSRMWINDALPRDPQAWKEGATQHKDTWWNDWATWIGQQSGELRDPPPMGSKQNPPGTPAPGTYVLG